MRRPLPVWLLLVGVGVGVGVACAGDPPASQEPADASATAEVVFRATGGERSLAVRVADTDQERERGLMGVRDLPVDEGMAFVFDGPTTASFWMKDTPIPLAIAFVGEDGHILGITEMTPCRTETCPTYVPPAPSTMAVEANAGWFGANGVRVGDETVLLEAG